MKKTLCVMLVLTMLLAYSSVTLAAYSEAPILAERVAARAAL